MIEYNLAAEYASLIIIIAILISFTRDYDGKTLRYRSIKYTYLIVLTTVLSTIAAIESGYPGEGSLYLFVAYFTNIIYFMLIPSVSLCYLLYTVVVTSLKYNERNLRRAFLLPCTPYGIYLILLLTNIHNGKVFYITEELGYVRGDWYQLPYVVVAINAIWVLALIFRYRAILQKSSFVIMGSSILLAVLSIGIQAMNPDYIMSGIICTMTILSIHLYIQNVRKSTDPLTRLPNRTALMHHLELQIQKKHDFSLYIFSVRGFKMINERYGLEFGDKVLTHISSTLIDLVKYDIVFRYNGDEFALLLPNDTIQCHDTVEQINETLQQAFYIEGNELFLDIVCARVDYGTFGTNIKDLISAADYSISVIKRDSSNVKYIYDTSVVHEIHGKLDMVQQLKHALANDSFEIHYQPIYSVHSKQFTQAEALIRMRNQDGTLTYPNDFIDLAERTGLIVPITYLVLEHVCADLHHLIETYGETLSLESISVNFPYLQFTTPHMQEEVMGILDRYQISPSQIKIEITERTMIADTTSVSHAMTAMQKQGFIFELDDFGVDYSNMYTFLYLPMNIIKLDRSLLLAASESTENRNFLEHMVAGIRSIGRQIIIEGVEESHQLSFILQCHCDYVQGFYFSKPLNIRDFELAISPKKQLELYNTMKDEGTITCYR